MAVFRIVGKVECTDIGGILVYDATSLIIGIFYIDLSLEILDSFHEAIRGIGILKAVTIRILN